MNGLEGRDGGTRCALQGGRRGNDAVYYRGDPAGVVVARARERIYARQLHLRPAGDRPGAVRRRLGQRSSDGLTIGGVRSRIFGSTAYESDEVANGLADGQSVGRLAGRLSRNVKDF